MVWRCSYYKRRLDGRYGIAEKELKMISVEGLKVEFGIKPL